MKAEQDLSEEKKHLIDLLTDAHSTLSATVEGIDPELSVHADTGWRIREIIGHIATWDREVAKSIRAFQAGTEYSIPDLDEDDFNQRTALAQQQLPSQQVFTEWERAREDFKAAVQELPLDLFPVDLLYPWGNERGSIAKLVEYMIKHDAEHRDEIVKAIEASREA